ncbi:protein RMD5 homolog [Argentina anserina]|uniref:protein RMD5 homolog n=1 Tax=Argentina anserina TaxID=57926 RepID=UPI0021767932|nr:protein RMD5 homolog [Potentilla anserina]
MDLIKDAFERVTKKQKLSSSKTQEVLDLIDQEIKQTVQKIQSCNEYESQVDFKSTIAELKNKLKDIAPLGQTESTQKELNQALSKYPKLLEKSFHPDIAKAYRNVEFDAQTVNEIIGSHFYRQGLFELGDCFLSEAGEPESAAAMKSQFQEMFQIVEAMKCQNLEPALKWAITNSDKLKPNGSDLLLKLHSLQYVAILQKGDRDEALHYARTYLAPFASDHMAEIQKLMVCLLYPGKLDTSPYFHLLSKANWDKVIGELTRQFCNILGQSYESPLSTTIAAGVQGLPPLLKFMNVMAGKRNEWQNMEQLPVPVELDREFQFHSVFVCPVSKEQATDENPPMLMSCGHVLCKQSITKMSKNGTKTFKCPYCPSDIDSAQCKQLHF